MQFSKKVINFSAKVLLIATLSYQAAFAYDSVGLGMNTQFSDAKRFEIKSKTIAIIEKIEKRVSSWSEKKFESRIKKAMLKFENHTVGAEVQSVVEKNREAFNEDELTATDHIVNELAAVNSNSIVGQKQKAISKTTFLSKLSTLKGKLQKADVDWNEVVSEIITVLGIILIVAIAIPFFALGTAIIFIIPIAMILSGLLPGGIVVAVIELGIIILIGTN